MGVISILGKVVLIIINLLILLLGIIFFVIGVVLVAGKDVYNSLVDTLKDELQKAATSAGVSNLDTSNLTLSEVTEPLAYFLIGLGIVMAGLAILGLVGACCTIKIVLIVYTIIISVIFLVQLIMVIIIYADKSAFDNAVKPHLKDTLSGYTGIEGTDAQSLIWNALMNYKDCCGIDNYNDFHDNGTVKNWPPANIAGYTMNDQKTPIMCCKVKTDAPYACAERATATDSNNNQSQGCYEKIYELTVENPVVITAFAIILALQAVCVFFSIWILCTMDNKVDII